MGFFLVANMSLYLKIQRFAMNFKSKIFKESYKFINLNNNKYKG